MDTQNPLAPTPQAPSITLETWGRIEDRVREITGDDPQALKLAMEGAAQFANRSSHGLTDLGEAAEQAKQARLEAMARLRGAAVIAGMVGTSATDIAALTGLSRSAVRVLLGKQDWRGTKKAL